MAGLIFVITICVGCSSSEARTARQAVAEDTLVRYPGRTFSYREKFNDSQSRQIQAAKAIGLSTPPKDRQQAAKMRSQLSLIKTNANYVVDSLTHSIPYLVPAAAAELERIGEEFADILQRNNLPHYRFYVTSVLRSKEDVKHLTVDFVPFG